MYIIITLNLSFLALPLAFFLGLKVVVIALASSIIETLTFSRLFVIEESLKRGSARTFFFGQITN